jgi:ribonuclease Z
LVVSKEVELGEPTFTESIDYSYANKTIKRLGASITLLAALLAAYFDAQTSQEADYEVIMMGLGSPPQFMSRFGAETLIKAGDKYLLVDSGSDVTQRLWQLKIPLGCGDGIFVTHLQSDPGGGIPDFLLKGWLSSLFGGRKGKFNI